MSKRSSMFRDSRWQQKRLEIMERDNWTCQSCGASGEGVMLNVHHAFYEKGKRPWEYKNYCLFTWCENCHHDRTIELKEIEHILAQLNIEEWNAFYGVMRAIDNMSKGYGIEYSQMLEAIKSITQSFENISTSTFENMNDVYNSLENEARSNQGQEE